MDNPETLETLDIQDTGRRQTKHKIIRLKSEKLYMGGDKHGQIDTIICLLFLLLKHYNEWNKKKSSCFIFQ